MDGDMMNLDKIFRACENIYKIFKRKIALRRWKNYPKKLKIFQSNLMDVSTCFKNFCNKKID